MMVTISRILYSCWTHAQKLEHVDEKNSQSFEVIQAWANEIFQILDVTPRVIHPPKQDEMILVGNHVSYLDIPLLMRSTPTCFLAKEILKHWPVIGTCAKRAGTLFVKRNSRTSRMEAARSLIQQLQNHSRPVTVFPSGTTTLGVEKPWKPGIFKIAQSTGKKIQPFRIRYQPGRTAAYIDRDFFPFHISRLAKQGPTLAEIEYGEPVRITHPLRQLKETQAWVNDEAWHTGFKETPQRTICALPNALPKEEG